MFCPVLLLLLVTAGETETIHLSLQTRAPTITPLGNGMEQSCLLPLKNEERPHSYTVQWPPKNTQR